MAEEQRGLEPVERSEMKYAPEPGFPWPLVLAWAVFVAWGIYYIATRLVPAYESWQIH